MVLIKINFIVSTRACHFNFQSAHWLYVLREIKKAKKKKKIYLEDKQNVWKDCLNTHIVVLIHIELKLTID